ncbi:MAG: hypothetical protein M1151_03645 [Candidatus Thermoplasmatota archaeon]|jgi:hypothetical protein|nr:hypothetical protein [Candidatus Thermoplasmatota archaeon]MCL5785749.1 hypothetical protein [Candidatus Thermoplasmatota archaeon]
MQAYRNKGRKPFYYERPVDTNQQRLRIKRLDMRRSDEFNYLLSREVQALPENVRGAIKGSIYAIASRKGSKEAKDYVLKKHEEGIIGEKLQHRLIDLIFDYSKYR